MKRDMDLVRLILLNLEKENTASGLIDALQFKEYSPDQIVEHVNLLRDAGFIKSSEFSTGIFMIEVEGIAWNGYEFLDSIRDDATWSKTKEIANKCGGFTLDLLGEIAKGLIKTQVKKHTGVEF
ncbi:MAG: DUF2513 domain-containing protein [Beijerinckiaceae bacterium]|jgi:hypothetical protein|nr:DUF2513 domain-containing protein [Beijerinckiaceae bacterium]